MPTLVLDRQPGFAQVSDAQYNGGLPATSPNLKALNQNAEFAAVRNEQFYGFYKHGETVGLPVSPADGYVYERTELRYSYSFYWTGAAPGDLLGTTDPPTRAAGTGQGTLLGVAAYVDQLTGLVSCDVAYYKTSQTDTHDGILLVITHGCRQR